MEVKDYTSDVGDEGNTHYNGVPSMFGRMATEQEKMQPKYCWPGKDDGQMHGDKRNVQAGP
jgi:hypothetical protein